MLKYNNNNNNNNNNMYNDSKEAECIFMKYRVTIKEIETFNVVLKRNY